ncbi:Uncharacterised protein [Klebsiella pneumoniae]|uniref:Uncharacterized protein n=1 Tax=Klebsiella pneumoniae TaxID=573 RepID=A0A377UVQ8_KLEPN|nr:Uncharacterised protein [Klebsiella pneumoniae]
MDHAAFVSHHHIVGQQVLPGVVLGDDPGQQVALGRDDFTVLVGVFVEQRGVGLLDEAADLLIEAAALLTLAIAVMAILNVGARQLLIGPDISWFSTAVWISLMSTWARPCICWLTTSATVAQ